MSNFGNRLRELRHMDGLSQSDLAKHLKISKSSINMYERGEREPNFETMEAIADFFNVDMDYLYGRSDRKNELKLKLDKMFRGDRVTQETMAHVIICAIENTSIDFSLIPDDKREMVKNAADFTFNFLSLPDNKRQEIQSYLKYLIEKEKQSET